MATKTLTATALYTKVAGNSFWNSDADPGKASQGWYNNSTWGTSTAIGLISLNGSLSGISASSITEIKMTVKYTGGGYAKKTIKFYTGAGASGTTVPTATQLTAGSSLGSYATSVIAHGGNSETVTLSSSSNSNLFNALVNRLTAGYTYFCTYNGETSKNEYDYYSDNYVNITALSMTVTYSTSTYSIVYNENGGSIVTDKTGIKVGDSVSIGTSSKTGYTFIGWTTNSDGKTDDGYGWTGWNGSWKEWNGSYGISNYTLTLYAIWEANTYTVTFNPNDGSVSTTYKSVTYDATYGTLPNPTKEDYNFNGWYTALSGGEEITSSTIVKTANSHTLYAHWTENSPTEYPITIQYNSLGYDSSIFNGNIVGGDSIKENVIQQTIQFPLPNGYKIYKADVTNATLVGINNARTQVIIKSPTGEVTITVTITKELTVNQGYTAEIKSNQAAYYSFIPSTTATYGIYSVHESGDTYVYLYDSSNNLLSEDDDTGSGRNFRLTYNLTAGETYRFRIKFYSSSTTGDIPFYFGEVYTVSIAGINNITEVTGSGAYIYQEACTINATPQEGYVFDRFELNGEEIKNNPYTFIPDEDITVNAYADRALYEISAVSNNTNQGTVSGGGFYTSGSQVTLTPTAKTGYQFNCWLDENYNTYYDNPLKWTVTSENKTFTAYFKEEEVQKYTITYHSNNSLNKTIEEEYDYNTTAQTMTAIQLLNENAIKSHTFYYNKNASDAVLAATNTTIYPTLTGWTTNADGTGEFYNPKGNIPILDDIHLYAQWEYKTQDALSTPTRSGYNFIGWFTAPTGGTKITIIDDNVASGITIYAHWSQEITYAVDCLISEGIESIQQEGELANGQRYKITAFLKEGYEFSHFIQDGSDTKIWQNPYEFIIDKPYTYFQAFAKKIQYEIKYNPTRGTGIMAPGYKTYGEPYKVATNEFSAPIDDLISYSLILDYQDDTEEKTVESIQNTIQYNFSHWNLNSTSGNVYYENSTYDINEEAEFFANWSSDIIKGTYTLPIPTRETNTVRTYTINFNANGGTTEKTQGECKVQNEYAFTNWSNGTNTFSGGSEFSFDGSESSITLSANWTSVTNRIPVIFPTKEECKRSGYNLLGWGTTANTTTPYAQPGEEKFISGSPTFYAIWEQITYSVTYDLNGGDKNDAFQDQTNLTSYTIPNVEPEKTNNEFAYWIIKETGDEYSPGDTISLTQNITLQAVWLGYYTITIRLPDEGISSVQFISGGPSVVAGSSVQIQATVQNAGYYFSRWVDNNGNQLSTRAIITINNINQNYIITPIAQPNYGIHLLFNKGQANFGVNGSTGSFYGIALYYNRFWYQTSTEVQGSAPDSSQAITQLTPPVRHGYKFTGYYLDDGTQVMDENGILTTDYTCITKATYANARWEPLGLVHIRVDNEWKYAIPYIYDGAEWRQAIAHVYEKKTPDSSEYEWKVSI